MTLIRWHQPEIKGWPIPRLHQLREEVNRWLDFPFEVENRSHFFNAWAPVLDISQDRENVFVNVEIPGMKKEEIEVSLHERTLTISGERRSGEQHSESEAHRSERFLGRFQRNVMLPSPVAADQVRALYKDGILFITLPKAEEAKPKQIEINVK